MAPALGIEIAGIDLSRALDERTVAALRAALDAHSVVLLRDQRLDPSGLAAAARHFGTLERFAPLQPRSPEHAARYLCPDEPDIMSIGNLEEGGKRIAMYTDEAPDWHIDYPYWPHPLRAIALYAVATPRAGGDTLFAGLHVGYDALDAATKRDIERLRCVYSIERLDAFHRLSDPTRPILTGATIAVYPPVSHPLVRVDPATGRKGLFLAPQATSHIESMSRRDSLALVQRLAEHALRPAFQYRHRWRNGDFLIWDNLATLHCATVFDAKSERRLLYRAMIAQRGGSPLPKGEGMLRESRHLGAATPSPIFAP